MIRQKTFSSDQQLLFKYGSMKLTQDKMIKNMIFNEMLRLLQELLEKAEENSSGEEQWDINFRKHTTQHTDTGSSKKKKKKVSESSKKGGSLSNLSCLSDFEVSLVCRLL